MHGDLTALGDRYWDAALAASPMWASLLGDHRFDADAEDFTRDREDDLIALFDGIVADATAIDPTELDRDDRITRAVLIAEVEGHAGDMKSRTAEYLVDPMLGLHMDIVQGIPQLRAENAEHAAAFVEKAGKVGRQFDQLIERHRQGVANGRTPPRVAVEKVIAQLDAFARLPAEQNPFLQITLPEAWNDLDRARWKRAMAEQVSASVIPGFARYREVLASEILPVARPPEQSGVCWLPDGDEIYARAVQRYTSLDLDRARWKRAMAEQVSSAVIPGFARYREVLASEILPVSRPPEQSGVCWLPDGDEIYARAVQRYTSLDLDPHEVHRIGLEEIAALEDEYRDLGGRVLGTTDVPTIYDRLRNDPDLRFGTADEVHRAAESALGRARDAVPAWFGRLPQAPCIVQPVPDVGAEDTTIAYYFPPSDDGARPGIYFINTSQPETRTRFESEVLAFHESIPGHHLQLALAQELEGIPAFRRHGHVTVYVEGWGLYTERLADEMGLYSSDVARLGILSFDSWRACRLVVDTGLHAMGWSRQQAIDYMAANSPQAMNNIANEVDRYIGYTAQALAYKIGQREIFRLRAEARAAMGGRFDIKGFHDTVLADGPVPLEVLGDLVREWAAG